MDKANLPGQKNAGGDYEIWFAVVFELQEQRAYWFRYTRYVPADGGGKAQAMVWAAAFDAKAAVPARASKRILPIDAFSAESSEFSVRVGEAHIGEGRLSGAVAGDVELSWDLRFDPSTKHAPRMSRLLKRLPLPVRSHHAHCDVKFSGEVTVDGLRRTFSDAVGTQMHIHGTTRVQELRWVYAPCFADGPGCELTSGKLPGPLPAVNALWMGHDDVTSMTSLVDAPLIAIDVPRPGMLRAQATTAKQKVVLRAWADPTEFVGYRYRDPTGSEVAVAQSDVASCSVEVFRRHGLAWYPHRSMASRQGAALEIHGADEVDGVRYIAWDETHAPAALPVDAEGQDDAPAPHAPGRILAFGLTYGEHIRETGSTDDKPLLFEKQTVSWAPEVETVVVPSSDMLLASLDRLSPGLARQLRARFGFLPAMMDYEVELGIQLLEPITDAELDAGRVPRVGYFVANDLTARSVQILGEGQVDRMAYWSLAKSLPGFLPVGRLWIPPDEHRERLPSLTLRTWGDPELRQESCTDDLILTLRQLLATAAAHAGGQLQRHDVLLTGTPSGVALAVPRWKRKMAELFLDRFGRLAAAISSYSRSGRFCGPGDVVQVDGEILGRRQVTLQLPVGAA